MGRDDVGKGLERREEGEVAPVEFGREADGDERMECAGPDSGATAAANGPTGQQAPIVRTASIGRTLPRPKR